MSTPTKVCKTPPCPPDSDVPPTTTAVTVVNKPSGLYQAIAVVRGATIKAGWIVLPDGTQVGSLEPNADAAAPSATRGPVLDVAAGTAQDGSTFLSATPVSGATGSGF